MRNFWMSLTPEGDLLCENRQQLGGPIRSLTFETRTGNVIKSHGVKEGTDLYAKMCRESRNLLRRIK